MDNQYYTNVNPYFAQQDQQGLSPVFQNIGQQQANQQAALAQQNQQVMQAGQTQQQGGMNPMAMAMALRKKDPNKPAPVTDYSQPMPIMDSAYNYAGY
jgi:hypothetical protein